jgi:hypothetical protein
LRKLCWAKSRILRDPNTSCGTHTHTHTHTHLLGKNGHCTCSSNTLCIVHEIRMSGLSDKCITTKGVLFPARGYRGKEALCATCFARVSNFAKRSLQAIRRLGHQRLDNHCTSNHTSLEHPERTRRIVAISCPVSTWHRKRAEMPSNQVVNTMFRPHVSGITIFRSDPPKQMFITSYHCFTYTPAEASNFTCTPRPGTKPVQ